MPNTKKVEFRPPSGLRVPEGTQGDHFEFVTTYEAKPNGDWCIVKIGDVEMPGYGDHDDKEKAPNYDKFGEDVASALRSQEGSQSPGPGYA